MTSKKSVALLALLTAVAFGADQPRPGRDPNQPVDEEYGKKIREYTTQPFFLSPLVDQLPASKNVPTPKAVIGNIACAPGKLLYTADVNRYMRMLEKGSPRVRVFSIGKSEEEREMIAVAVTSEANMAKMEETRARIVMHFADARVLQISGLLEGGGDIAQRPAVVDVPVGDGHVVPVSNNPVWRGETRRSNFLVLNAILNFNSLDAGRKLNVKQPCRSGMH